MNARQTLIANSAASYVTALYVSVYAYPENSAGRRMYDEAAIADLISPAHKKGMSVHAAYGAPDWPLLGCGDSFPQQRMQEVLAYNAAHPAARHESAQRRRDGLPRFCRADGLLERRHHLPGQR